MKTNTEECTKTGGDTIRKLLRVNFSGSEITNLLPGESGKQGTIK